MASIGGRKALRRRVRVRFSLDEPFKAKWPKLSNSITEAVTDLLTTGLTEALLHRKRADPRQWLNRARSRKKDDAGTTTEAQDEDEDEDEDGEPSGWSSRTARSELAVGTNEVLRALERDSLGLVLMCASARFPIMSRHVLLLCVSRSVPAARLRGLGARTAAVLSLRSVLALGFRRDCVMFADTMQAITTLLPSLCVPWLLDPRAEGAASLEGSHEGLRPEGSGLQPTRVLRSIPNPSKANKKKMKKANKELCSFRKAGGGTVVENSSIGLHRNVKALQQISLDSGVNVICGTGFYVDSFHSKETKSMSEEQLAEVMRRELEEGVDGTGIRCGIIGEIGCSWPITESEVRVLRAAATVQASLHCPIIVHPGRHHDAPFQIVRLLQESGADLHKTVMSHIDRTLFEKNQLLEFAKLGCYLEYDLFGLEILDYELNLNVDMPCDSERIRSIQMLLEEGLVDQLLMSHDIFSWHRLSRFGGHGYSHILQNIVPKMQRRGVPQAAIERMLIHNPRTWLTTCR
uniref:N-acetyltaurine hydrolase n=1 Tax=Eptatretus burgeri TaxID=7764 RepID=A0A8C4NAE0_EPTBU